MSTLYLIALVGVGVALLAALLETLWSVSRRPHWETARPLLVLVETDERRQHALPYVGTERRDALEQAAEAALAVPSREAA